MDEQMVAARNDGAKFAEQLQKLPECEQAAVMNFVHHNLRMQEMLEQMDATQATETHLTGAVTIEKGA